MAERSSDAPVESVLSAAASAHISHAVIAAYAAAAAIEVEGVHAVAGTGTVGLDPERAPKGVRVTSDDDGLGLELHLIVDWGASIPGVAADVVAHVREYLRSMIDLAPATVQVVVDDVAGPT
jgi:uncharacterized alkaline shock family protein YloU